MSHNIFEKLIKNKKQKTKAQQQQAPTQPLTSEEAGRKPKPVGAFSSCSTPLTPGLKWSSTWKRSSDEMSCVWRRGDGRRHHNTTTPVTHQSADTPHQGTPQGIFHTVQIRQMRTDAHKPPRSDFCTSPWFQLYNLPFYSGVIFFIYIADKLVQSYIQ